METIKNFFESDSMYYIIFVLSLILCVGLWVVLNKKEEEMHSWRAETDFNPNEAEPITIEELLTAINDGYVTELSSWDWEGKIYTSLSEYFLLKILDDEFCAIKTQSSKWEILLIKELCKKSKL